MFDRFMYKLLGTIDNLFSNIETYAVKTTAWLWSQRVKILRKKRGRKK